MIKYLGHEFKNHAEFETWNKEQKIEEYKSFFKLFNADPSMECNKLLCEMADFLVSRFGLTYSDIEDIEMSVF